MCKLFDLFTPFSMGLIYIMYRAFEKICIHKPHTSRPANSERSLLTLFTFWANIGWVLRYIVAKNLLPQGCTTAAEYLRIINDKMDVLEKVRFEYAKSTFYLSPYLHRLCEKLNPNIKRWGLHA